MFGAEQGGRFSPAVKAALCEDAAGCGTRVDASLAARLSRIGAGGRPMPRRLAARMEREFACDLSRIRLHAGPGVDQMAAFFRARAFCVGTDLFFTGPVLSAARGTPDLDVLRHELAHVVYRVEPERIRFWGHRDHGDLTVKACRAFSSEFDRLVKLENLDIDKTDLFKGLYNASSNMDIRQRIRHAGTTIKYGAILVAQKIGIKVATSGEGPRHGEALNYQHGEDDDEYIWYRYEAINVAEQKRWLGEAKKEFDSDLDSWIDDIVPTFRGPHFPGVGPITLNEKPWVKSLANALHVAQDRGAHREGVKGHGHDDPRCPSGWDPDAPIHDHTQGRSWKRCSKAAYNKAVNNSYEVLKEFFDRIQGKTGIQARTPPKLPEECSTLRIVAGRRPKDAPKPLVESPPPEIYISPYPNPFNKAVLGQSLHSCGRTFKSPCALQILAARAEELPGNPPWGLRR
jgi:hypothetical protein